MDRMVRLHQCSCGVTNPFACGRPTPAQQTALQVGFDPALRQVKKLDQLSSKTRKAHRVVMWYQ